MRTDSSNKLQVGSLALSVLLSSIGTSMVNMALPAISADYASDFSTTKWIILSYLISSTLISLVVGQLGDSKGRKAILLAGTALFSASSLIGSVSNSMMELVLARALQGIGASALIVLPITLIVQILPEEKSGRAIGLLSTMSAVGTAAGPSLGGYLISIFGWRSVFCLMGIMGISVFLLAFRFIPKFLNQPQAKTPRSQTDQTIYMVFLSSPLSRPLGFHLTVSAVMMTTLVVGPFFLNQGLHLDPSQVGLIMSVGPVTSMISGIPSGYLVDRYGYQTISRIALAQLLVGTLSFAATTPYLGALGFVLSAALLSIGYQLFQASNSTGIMKRADQDMRGRISGALNFSRNMGLISGTYFMGGIFDLCSKVEPSPQATVLQYQRGLQITFLIAALFIVLMLIVNSNSQKKEAL